MDLEDLGLGDEDFDECSPLFTHYRHDFEPLEKIDRTGQVVAPDEAPTSWFR